MSALRAAFVTIFFASGFAALLYQIIWQRMLTLFAGNDIHAVTVVVAAFMAGLGFGSLAGGYVADRLSGMARLVAFAVCELAVGGFALVSDAIYYDWLYVDLGGRAIAAPTLGVVVFLVTLWPTFFMGMSLPLAARALTAARQPARWIPILYGWNALGAAAGSFAAVVVLFRTMAFPDSLWLAASINALCACACLIMAPRLLRLPDVTDAGDRSVPVPARQPRARAFGVATWIAIYTLSGFVALALEILWFRVLGVMLKSNSMTFGLLLSVYLAGIGLGALVANRWRATPSEATRSFFLLQLAIPLYAALALAGFVYGVEHAIWARPLWEYMAGTEPLARSDAAASPILFSAVYLGLPIVFIGPPTILMGLTFGLLQRAVQADVEHLGRRLGWLQTANITGGILGTLFTGLWLLDAVGSTGMLRLLTGLGAIFAVAYARMGARPIRDTLGGLVAVVLTIAVVPSPDRFWARLHGSQAAVIQDEDGSGVALAKPYGDTQTMFFANGLGQGTLPYGNIHTVLSGLPLMLHPAPKSIAIIGLGSGDTAFGAGGRQETVRIDSIEIIASEAVVLRALDRHLGYEPLRRLFTDPRVHHTFTDGRTFLRKSATRYDIIEADALRPRSAYSGNLYSVEYFRLLASRLQPGGFAVTWAPTERVVDTVIAAFPHVRDFGGVVIGSDAPIPFELDVVRARMRSDFTRGYYAAAGIDIERLLMPSLDTELRTYGPDFDRQQLTDINHDLFPRDEFALPYRGVSRR